MCLTKKLKSWFTPSLQVAELACSISPIMEGVKFVKMAAQQLDQLCPQVKEHICA